MPDGVDYDLWLGPAPERPFNPNRFHYDWHWFWDYGNGDLGNQGIHQMDLARWGMGKNEFPKAVLRLGRPVRLLRRRPDPEHAALVAFEFDDCELQFEVRGLPTNAESQVKIGDIFYGTEGFLAITSYPTGTPSLAPSSRRDRRQRRRRPLSELRQGRQGRDPIAQCRHRGGHLRAYCHLGNIAYRLGRKFHINPPSRSSAIRRRRDAHARISGPFVVPTKV